MSPAVNRRSLLFENSDRSVIIKSLCSSSIKEPAINLQHNGIAEGSCQAVEIYQGQSGKSAVPQIVADICSNTYLRLTYHKNSGASGTFGTSMVGVCSFRTENGKLNFIPEVESGELLTDVDGKVRVVLAGRFKDLARIESVREYRLNAASDRSEAFIRISFVANKDIELSRQAVGNDCFRLFTLSSMYSGQTCYDGNLIEYYHRGSRGELSLEGLRRRDSYLFRQPVRCTGFTLVNSAQNKSSTRGVPGAADSPSVSVSLNTFSADDAALALQGYLAGSRDVNSDSLTVWLEWLNAPHVIRSGTRLEIELIVRAFEPGREDGAFNPRFVCA